MACVLEFVPACISVPKLAISLRDDAHKWRGDFRIVIQSLIVGQPRLGYGHLALRGLEAGFGGFDLRFGGEILALRLIHFLLCDESGLALRDVVQALVLKVRDFVLRLDSTQLMLCVRDLIGHVLDGSLIFLQESLEFRDLQNREELAFFHVRTVIDVQLGHESGFLGEHVDFLEGHKFGGEGEITSHWPPFDFGNGNRRQVVLRRWAGMGFGAPSARDERDREQQGEEGKVELCREPAVVSTIMREGVVWWTAHWGSLSSASKVADAC